MKNKIFTFFALVLIMSSCNLTKETKKIQDAEEMIIASRQADCVGVGLQKCLLVKIGSDTEWTFFYDGIKGFNYEVGYEYVIEVKKDTVKAPPADASSIQYTFVKEISKIQKDSENLPEIGR